MILHSTVHWFHITWQQGVGHASEAQQLVVEILQHSKCYLYPSIAGVISESRHVGEDLSMQHFNLPGQHGKWQSHIINHHVMCLMDPRDCISESVCDCIICTGGKERRCYFCGSLSVCDVSFRQSVIGRWNMISPVSRLSCGQWWKIPHRVSESMLEVSYLSSSLSNSSSTSSSC